MVNLKIPPEKAILLLDERLDAIGTIQPTPGGLEYYDVVGWMTKTCSAIDAIYEAGDLHTEEIRSIMLSNCSCNDQVKALMLAEEYHALLVRYIAEIRNSLKTPE